MKDCDENGDTRRTMRRAARMLDDFRLFDAEMPMQQAALFLAVAAKEGTSLVDLRDTLRMSSASASRNIAALSKVHRLGKPGLDLVGSREDPADRRKKIYTLTRRGQQLLTRILSHWGD